MSIELTEQQIRSLDVQRETPPEFVHPQTREEFVLLRKAEYERLKEADYDTEPWTEEEMAQLASEDADSLGWDGMDAYQDEDT
jgi:PHD/YefM family antitoxin component YafN of YafNO toxin-antitoxin module